MTWPRLPRFDSGYIVALVAADADTQGVGALLARELAPAFATHGLDMRIVDYRKRPREVMNALNDAACRFALCFDGMGSELLVASRTPGAFRSAFEYTEKPLFDLMHACPAHESMGHQIDSCFRLRTLLLTDPAQIGIAVGLGIRNAKFAPTIAYPATLAHPPLPFKERGISVLLPVSAGSAQAVRARHTDITYRARVYHCIFDAVVELCATNLRLDPMLELFSACSEAGIPLQLDTADGRFLLSSVIDCVTAERQQNLLRALAHLPVHVVSPEPPQAPEPMMRMQWTQATSRESLLHMMAQSCAVIIPPGPWGGHDPLAIGAMAAGAFAVAAPNHVLEAEFCRGREIIMASTIEQFVQETAYFIENSTEFEAAAMETASFVNARFSPTRLADLILSAWQAEHMPSRTDSSD